MVPTSFDESNVYFDKPEGMSDEECGPLSVFRGHDPAGKPLVISCWKLTKEELEEIQKTGRVWCVHLGSGLQPHVLMGTSPFK